MIVTKSFLQEELSRMWGTMEDVLEEDITPVMNRAEYNSGMLAGVIDRIEIIEAKLTDLSERVAEISTHQEGHCEGLRVHDESIEEIEEWLLKLLPSTEYDGVDWVHHPGTLLTRLIDTLGYEILLNEDEIELGEDGGPRSADFVIVKKKAAQSTKSNQSTKSKRQSATA